MLFDLSPLHSHAAVYFRKQSDVVTSEVHLPRICVLLTMPVKKRKEKQHYLSIGTAPNVMNTIQTRNNGVNSLSV